jgi:hypothetical protein
MDRWIGAQLRCRRQVQYSIAARMVPCLTLEPVCLEKGGFMSEQRATIGGREYGLGRRRKEDKRDYLVWKSPLRVAASDRSSRFWYMGGAWLDQNGFPHCVGYSWTHWIEDGPVEQPNIIGNDDYADKLYRQCQKIDEWPGEDYDGTSVRAGAKILRSRGVLSSYYFAHDIESVKLNVLERGPVVLGTTWYRSMFRPRKYDDRTYVCEVDESSGSGGGHAYLLNGINLDKEIGGETGFFRLKNSWGRDWAFEGRCFISIADVEKLLEDGGEMCIATERRV